MENYGLWWQDAKEGCAMANYVLRRQDAEGCALKFLCGGDATASKGPIKLRKQHHRERKKMASRQSKIELRRSELQTFGRRAFTGGSNLVLVKMADGSMGVRSLTLQEEAQAQEEKAQARAHLFKERVNLMAKLADSKKKKEAKLADAKEQEAKLADAKKEQEAKLADAKEEEEPKLADAKEEEAMLADAKEEEDAMLADVKKEDDVMLADVKEDETMLADAKEEEAKLADAKEEEGAKLADAKEEEEAKLADAKEEEAKPADAKEDEAKLAHAKKEEAKLADWKKEDMEIMAELDRLKDDRNKYLLQPRLTWEQKVVNILQMVRCRELTEYNHKLGFPAHTRFCCTYNIAFFDLDKESKGMPWKPIDKIPSPCHQWLADSVNVVAIKVAKSDRDYPISIFGTVLARDEYDYRCVYLFKRGWDDPQVITSKDDTLTLMGPYRALAVSDSMYFEFHLKVKGDGDVVEDFSKGILVYNAVCHSEKPVITNLLYSCLSTVELVYTPVPYAVEASFAVSILKGPSDFIGKVTAWTTGNEENKITVYNKEVAGVEPCGSVHGLVAVALDEKLVLHVCVSEHCEHERGKCFELALGHGIDEYLAGQEPYEMQVKISWRGVVNRCGTKWGRPNMWARLGGVKLLL